MGPMVGNIMATITGTATVANYQTALESVTYTDTLHDSSTSGRTVSFVASDGNNASNMATRTVTSTDEAQ